MAENPKIVGVEDDTSFASFLEMALEEANYQVFVFYDP
jgi:DNA-binding response OmpR family regulator